LSNGLLLFIMFGAFVGYYAFSKQCSNSAQRDGSVGYAFFLLVTGIVACIFFFFAGGCRIAATPLTLLYAMGYAVIAIVCSVFVLKAYRYAEVANVTVITSACSLITTSGVGCLLFRETLDFIKILRIAIMFTAIVLVFADGKKRDQIRNFSPVKKELGFLFVVLVLIAGNCASVIELKYYSAASGVADENSFFFYTNVFIILAVLLWFAYRFLRNKAAFRKQIPQIAFKSLVPMAGGTVCSNLNSIVSIHLIASMDVSIYTPVVSAIEIVSGVIASVLFREKIGFYAVLALLLAGIAVII